MKVHRHCEGSEIPLQCRYFVMVWYISEVTDVINHMSSRYDPDHEGLFYAGDVLHTPIVTDP